MSARGMYLSSTGYLNTRRLDHLIYIPGAPIVRSIPGPEPSTADLSNVAYGNEKMAASQYNTSVKDLYDVSQMMINDHWINHNQIWVLLKCVKLIILGNIIFRG